VISNNQRERLNVTKSYFRGKVDFYTELLKNCECDCSRESTKNKIAEYRNQLTNIEMIFLEEDKENHDSI
jgi:hypothetical protein